MKSLMGAVFVALIGIGVLTWGPTGCATREVAQPQPNPRSARDYEPDGGWANYRPSGNDTARQREVDPAGGPLGAPIVPITPGSPSVSPTVH